MAGRTNRSAKKLSAIKAQLAGKQTMLIVMQDNPDPDALAAAAALRRIGHDLAGVQCSIACGGTVGRAENRAMVRYLSLNLRPLDQLDVARFDVLAMVDTQPGTGNNSLPEGTAVQIVIDHHPMRRETRAVPVTDVRRRYGATSSILYEYLKQAGITPDPPLATALLYGIRSDTQDLGRDATQADVDAYEALYPPANKRMLSAIQRGQVPTEYFRLLAVALDSARLCGSCIYCELGPVDNPDMIAEVADLLLRHEEASWSLCWGRRNGRILLSLRTSATDARADHVIRRIVSRKGTSGGHDAMAGGQIPLGEATAREQKRLDTLIRKRYFRATGNDPASCRKLV